MRGLGTLRLSSSSSRQRLLFLAYGLIAASVGIAILAFAIRRQDIVIGAARIKDLQEELLAMKDGVWPLARANPADRTLLGRTHYYMSGPADDQGLFLFVPII